MTFPFSDLPNVNDWFSFMNLYNEMLLNNDNHDPNMNASDYFLTGNNGMAV